MTTRSLYDMTLPELTAWVTAQGEPAYRARQIFQAIYQRGTTTVEAMTDLPTPFREAVTRAFAVATIEPVEHQQSADGTVKWLSSMADGQAVETVLIPAPRGMAGSARKTVCVSTQVGCAYACAFCASGQAGFRRNLTAGEIVQQVLLVQQSAAGDAARPPDVVGGTGGGAPAATGGGARRGRTRGLVARVTHVVFMGMGEPLANYDAVLAAIRIFNAPEGLKLGARKITISTVGLVPMIERLAAEGLQIELSVSLHAPNDELRGRLMPVNAKYPLSQLIPCCRAYSEQTKRQVTFEYILMDHVNDSEREARQLVELLKGMLSKVNLIPCHPTPGTSWAQPPYPRMVAFEQILRRGGIPATLRRSRGLDIDGACGQLRLRRIDGLAQQPV